MDSFGSASELYRKLKDEHKPKAEPSDSEEHKQRHPSSLRRQRDSSSDSHSSGHIRKKLNKSRIRKRVHYDDGDEESIHSSRAVVRAEYDHGYERLGDKFAIGDCTCKCFQYMDNLLTFSVLAQNQLQAQIILIQQTVIATYQECFALSHTHTPSAHHLSQLLQATRAARAASTAALTELYQRLSPDLGHHRQRVPDAYLTPPSSSPTNPARREKESRWRHWKPHHWLGQSHPPRSLFCPYARDLQQHANQPLAAAYLSGGDGHCPCCRTHIPIQAGKVWELALEDPEHRHGSHWRTFILKPRFVIKCHRDTGGFACYLCSTRRKFDTACEDVTDLIEHVWQEHSASDVLGDQDIYEIGQDIRIS
jgi:hypothetical protein